jgi:hypothetical protein
MWDGVRDVAETLAVHLLLMSRISACFLAALFGAYAAAQRDDKLNDYVFPINS